jgi:hypothetical protein
MNPIDANATLPTFHDRVPARGEKDAFMQLLQQPAPANHRFGDTGERERAPADSGQLSVSESPAQRPGSMATELYGFSSHPLHRLSYLASPESPPTAGSFSHAGTTHLLAGLSVLSHGGMTSAPDSAVGADTDNRALAMTPPVRQMGEPEAEPDVSTPLGWESLPERWLRKVRFLPGQEGVEAVLREEASPAPDLLVEKIVEHCRASGIKLARIVLNGQVVWARQEQLGG